MSTVLTPRGQPTKRLLGRLCVFSVWGVLLGCSAERLALRPSDPDPVWGEEAAATERLLSPNEQGISSSELIANPDGDWALATASPRPAAPGALVLPGCARYEAGLTRVAEAIARRQARGLAAWEGSELIARLRATGTPHVWPRLWTLEAHALHAADVVERFETWIGAAAPETERRCGVAQVHDAGARDVVAVVVVEALADLEPLPLRARLGQWLRLEARLNGAEPAARVLISAARGRPRAVPSRLDQGALHAVFSLDQPGLWRVQVLIDTRTGPRPALEAWVFVDAEPTLHAGLVSAPGEERNPRGLRELDLAGQRQALFEMLNAARASEQTPPLHRQTRLDELAQAHVEAMRRRGMIAHDSGDGLPPERLDHAGLSARRVGENVAFARTLGAAHRALWDSPSHRGNLLDAGFGAVGLGIAVAPPASGSSAGEGASAGVWVCELFADYGDSGEAITTPP
jgi:uncharacterized protein YkwD